jgi:uncharacterized phage protein gp47/JayE
LRDGSRLRRDQVPQTIRRIVAAHPILIRIHLQHILRPIRIVLQRRQALDQARAEKRTHRSAAGGVAAGHKTGRLNLVAVRLDLSLMPAQAPAIGQALWMPFPLSLAL